MTLPQHVTLVEVGPRDGLQSEQHTLTTAQKLELIRRLVDSGLSIIEATSFVPKSVVPQLGDHQELLSQLCQQGYSVRFPVLVPNTQGLSNALDAGAKEIAVLAAASETFSQKNLRCSVNESLVRIKQIIALAKPRQLRVRGYLSTVLGCPYEGEVDKMRVADLTEQLLELGCDEVSLGDTIGVGTPNKAQQVVAIVLQRADVDQIALHFHDTYGQALANIYACLQLGIHIIDCSVAGLGGCPYATGASGNVATEDVVYLLNGLGIETGVKLDALVAAGQYVCELLDHPTRSKVAQALSK